MAEPYCVHPFARYRFNPFAGVVCEECSSCFGLTCDDNFSTSLLKHEKNCHTGEGKTPLTSDQRDRVNLKLPRDGRELVSHVVSLLRDDRHSEAKSYLTTLLGEECVFYYCTRCQKRLATGKKPCCLSADLEQRKGHLPRNVGVGCRTRPIIWADFDPADQAVFCDMYRRYVRDIENGVATAREQFGLQANYILDFNPGPLHSKKRRISVHPEDEPSDISFTPPAQDSPGDGGGKYGGPIRLSVARNVWSQTTVYAEIQSYLPAGSAGPILKDFLDKTRITGLAVGCFKDIEHFAVWARIHTDYSKKGSPELEEYDLLKKACSLWYRFCRSFVPVLEPGFRADLMRVGEYRNAQLSQECRRMFDEVASKGAKSGGDDPDGQLFTDAQRVKFNEFFAYVTKDEGIYSSFLRLKAVSPSTEDRYLGVLARYLMFLYRKAGNDRNGQPTKDVVDTSGSTSIYADHLVPMLVNLRGRLDQHDQGGLGAVDGDLAKDVFDQIQWMVFQSLRLEDEAPSNGLLNGGMSLPGLFCRASAIEDIGGKNGFSVRSPASVHANASAVLHCIRMAYAMHSIHLSNSGVPPPVGRHAFRNSVVVLDVTGIQTVAKRFEQDLSPGGAKAVATKSAADVVIPDTFTTSLPGGGSLTLDRHQISLSCLGMLGAMRKGLFGLLSLALECIPAKSRDQHPSLSWFWSASERRRVLNCVFTEPVKFIPPNLTTGVQTYSAKIDKKPPIKCAILSVTFAAEVAVGESPPADDEGGGSFVSVTGQDLATILFLAMEASPVFRLKVDEYSENATGLLGAQMMQQLHGQGRSHEVALSTIGVTNHKFAAAAAKASTFPFSRENSRLMIYFHQAKYGKSKPLPMAMPEELARCTGLVAVLRQAQVKYLEGCTEVCYLDGKGAPIPRAGDLRVELIRATTHLNVRISIGTTLPAVEEVGNGRFNSQVLALLNQYLGLPDDSILTLAMYRQVHAAMSNAVVGGLADDRSFRSIKERAARGFGHSVETDTHNYGVSVLGSDGLLHDRYIDEEMSLCMAFSDYLFIGGWCCVGGNSHVTPEGVERDVNVLPPWRRFRALSDLEAHGLLVLSAYGTRTLPRAPAQAHIASAAVSCFRDTNFVYPCGYGKTLANFALPAYQLVGWLLRRAGPCDDPRDLLTFFQEHVESEGRPFDVEEWDAILGSESVKAFLEFVRKDPVPPPTYTKTLVISPFKAVIHELHNELQATNLVRSVILDRNSLPNVCSELEMARNAALANEPWASPGTFDVIVLTAAFAVQPDVRVVLENAMSDGLVASLNVEEAHAFLGNVSFQPDLRKLTFIRRTGVPLVGISGSVHSEMEQELSEFLLSGAGAMSPHDKLAMDDGTTHSVQLSGSGLTERREHFLSSMGTFRPDSTIPLHIRHAVLDDNLSSGYDSDDNLERIARFAGRLGSGSVLLLCPTPKFVERLGKVAAEMHGPSNVFTLAGGMDDSRVMAFHAGWTHGEARFALATSVAAQCLNNPRCDTVVWLYSYYGICTLVQGACRAGRKQQPSTHVFLHSRAKFASSLRSDARKTNIHRPRVQRALCSQSMVDFLCTDRSQARCRRVTLSLEMDGRPLPPNEGGSDWCCDVCDAGFLEELTGKWADASSAVQSLEEPPFTEAVRAAVPVNSSRRPTHEPPPGPRSDRKRRFEAFDASGVEENRVSSSMKRPPRSSIGAAHVNSPRSREQPGVAVGSQAAPLGHGAVPDGQDHSHSGHDRLFGSVHSHSGASDRSVETSRPYSRDTRPMQPDVVVGKFSYGSSYTPIDTLDGSDDALARYLASAQEQVFIPPDVSFASGSSGIPPEHESVDRLSEMPPGSVGAGQGLGGYPNGMSPTQQPPTPRIPAVDPPVGVDLVRSRGRGDPVASSADTGRTANGAASSTEQPPVSRHNPYARNVAAVSHVPGQPLPTMPRVPSRQTRVDPASQRPPRPLPNMPPQRRPGPEVSVRPIPTLRNHTRVSPRQIPPHRQHPLPGGFRSAMDLVDHQPTCRLEAIQKELRLFFTMDGDLHGYRRCFWHRYVSCEPHRPGDSILQGGCGIGYRQFMGLTSEVPPVPPCKMCGSVHHLSERPCMARYVSGGCKHCCVHNDNGPSHTYRSCDRSARVMPLVIWALRTDDGYSRVQRIYASVRDQIFGPVLDLPPKCLLSDNRFSPSTWGLHLQDICGCARTNACFFYSVKHALEEVVSEGRLR